MTASHIALLEPPGVLSVTGADAHKLLNGLITNNMDRLKTRGDAIHAALLTPQGKILFAFFVVHDNEGFLIETQRSQVADLAKRLTFYKLRAAVKIEDVSERYGSLAVWSREPQVNSLRHGAETWLSFRDPRHPDLGWRMLFPVTDSPAANTTASQYHANRIALGVPEAGLDYPLSDTYPHEADFDLFHGADFEKGCFVGQEVVARMQHKTAVRRRVVRVRSSAVLPADHPEILAGTVAIGRLGSVDGHNGLALMRLDRVVEALAKGEAVTAGGAPLLIEDADLARYREAAALRVTPS